MGIIQHQYWTTLYSYLLFQLKLKTEFKTKVNLNNPVLNQTCTMHVARQL